MSDKIEVYLRDTGERALLNFHIPHSIREKFIRALSEGSFFGDHIPIGFEASLQPKWITDNEKRIEALRHNESVHFRVSISAINVQVTE